MSDLIVHRHPASFLEVGTLAATQGTGAQYGATVLGWKKSAAGSFRMAVSFRPTDFLRCGNSGLLRYIYNGKMIGYRTDVLHAQLQPFPFYCWPSRHAGRSAAPVKHGRVTAQEPIVLLQADQTCAISQPVVHAASAVC